MREWVWSLRDCPRASGAVDAVGGAAGAEEGGGDGEGRWRGSERATSPGREGQCFLKFHRTGKTSRDECFASACDWTRGGMLVSCFRREKK